MVELVTSLSAEHLLPYNPRCRQTQSS